MMEGRETKERMRRTVRKVQVRKSRQAVIVIVVSYLVISNSISVKVCACFRRLSSSAGQSVGSDAIAANGRGWDRGNGVLLHQLIVAGEIAGVTRMAEMTGTCGTQIDCPNGPR
jgi:hypothetical protein